VHLVDLASQAFYVEQHLAGLTIDEKVAWLSARGVLDMVVLQDRRDGPTNVYYFQSHAGLRCAFVFRDGRFLFYGDHSTFMGRE
jgi:hypothetical protein